MQRCLLHGLSAKCAHESVAGHRIVAQWIQVRERKVKGTVKKVKGDRLKLNEHKDAEIKHSTFSPFNSFAV